MNSHGLTKENLLLNFPVALREDESAQALADVTARLLAGAAVGRRGQGRGLERRGLFRDGASGAGAVRGQMD